MKKLYVIIFTLVASLSSYAQSNKEDVDLIQAMYGKDKKTVVAGFVQLEGAQKDAFWKLYDEYETKRKELGKKRVALLEKYAGNYSTLDDAKTDEIIREMTSLGVKTDELVASYYEKLKKASSVKAAAQFVQIESYLLSAIRVKIFESIPFIGELDKK